MTVKSKWKITHVRNRLGELLASKGGMSREDALSEASRLVEMEREASETDIRSGIAALETLVGACAGSRCGVPDADMRLMLQKAGSLLILTGTFGFDVLDAVVKSFCDLLSGMILKDMHAIEPIAVHIRAMRLCTPGAEMLSGDEARQVLTELGRTLAHLGCERQPAVDDI